MGKLRKLCRAWDRSLQLFFLNEECLVDVLHQSALTTSLPFVHTARRCYRCQLDTGQRTHLLSGCCGEVDPCLTSRGSKSRNKVAVGEPAAGSFRKSSLTRYGRGTSTTHVVVASHTVYYRQFLFGVALLIQTNLGNFATTHNGGCLGFSIDEGRGNMR